VLRNRSRTPPSAQRVTASSRRNGRPAQLAGTNCQSATRSLPALRADSSVRVTLQQRLDGSVLDIRGRAVDQVNPKIETARPPGGSATYNASEGLPKRRKRSSALSGWPVAESPVGSSRH
jgi:hypothetical protein